ncbi:hypothetical protein [Mycolicibacterium komossense]|uniref:Uncharacterized protein n=1 Tax=Mycolicibacterium komossense TaxID=1779 RepID=A0ABT3C5Q6_9MYCO|nr:hypothetical protein [Mycolicibacterium komossense]MCV7224795.1 hypothetical protein [Mycolicibacterium komossense]
MQKDDASPPEEPFDPLQIAFDPDNPLAPLAALDTGPLGIERRLSNYFTLLDVVTTCPLSPWEPAADGSARAALEAWYAASVDCLAARSEGPEIPRRDGEDEDTHRLRTQLVTKRRAESQRDADLLTESYEAGLVSVGAGDGGWVERSRRRVTDWPGCLSFSRLEHLWALDDPLYVTSREWLPVYWGDRP